MADDRDAADRAAYEATGNPLYVFSTIGRYAVDEPLPDWTRLYLRNCTREMCKLWRLTLDQEISPPEAVAKTAHSFSLVNQTRNRFAEARQLREDSFTATLYELGPRKGETEAWATDLAEARGLTPRSIRRTVAKMRRIWGR
jgi:hypothetical protein